MTLLSVVFLPNSLRTAISCFLADSSSSRLKMAHQRIWHASHKGYGCRSSSERISGLQIRRT